MFPHLALRHDFTAAAPSHRQTRRPMGRSGDGLLRRWLQAAHRHWRRRDMITTFEAMNDRALRDIGIYRGDIRRLVKEFDDRDLGLMPRASAGRSWRA